MLKNDENQVVSAPPGFCSAPWLEAVLFDTGETFPCYRNRHSLGDWQKEGLKEVWQGQRFQEFRKKIASGVFPDSDCRSCYQTKNMRIIWNCLSPVFDEQTRILTQQFPEYTECFRSFFLVFRQRTMTSQAEEKITKMLATICAISAQVEAQGEVEEAATLLLALRKLKQITVTIDSYLRGGLVPPLVAPDRQLRLMSKCNSRCRMCAGLYNGEIFNGQGIPNEFMEEAIAHPEDILTYAQNTGEFLMHPQWKSIVQKIKSESGTKLRMMTNGKLLTQANVRFLVDNDCINSLHISVNGATKKTVEFTQVGVPFLLLEKNIRFLFEYAEQTQTTFQVNLSFIVMKSTYHEIAAFVDLVADWYGKKGFPKIAITYLFLENDDIDAYRSFLFAEHHCQIPRHLLIEQFHAAFRRSLEVGIPLFLYTQPLSDFIFQELPFPEYVPRSRDKELFKEYHQLGVDRANPEIPSKYKNNPIYRRLFESSL